MASPKVKNCFSQFSVAEFDTIEAAAKALAGDKPPGNEHYAQAVSAIIADSRAKLESIAQPVTPRPTEDSVQQTAQRFVDAFGKFAPKLHVLPNGKGVLPNADGTEKGAHHNGAIYLFTDNVDSTMDAIQTLWHEAFHYGLRKLLSRPQFIEQMTALYNRDSLIKQVADAWAKTTEGKRVLAAEGEDFAKARGVDEALAGLSQMGGGEYQKNGALVRAYRAVVEWLAGVSERMGLNKVAASLRGITNKEAREFIKNVFARVKDGEQRGFAMLDDAQFSKPDAAAEAAIAAKTAQLVADAEAAYRANPPRSMPPKPLAAAIEALPQSWRPSAFTLARVLTGKAGDAINAVAFTEDLIDRAKSLGIAAADTYRALVRKQSAVAGAHEREVQRIAALYAGIEEEHKGLGLNTANQYLHDSTMKGKWGYRPEHIAKDGFAVDPEMEAAFAKLKPKAQEYVKAVFAHGHMSMQEKKKAVLDSVPSIFDSLIAMEADPKERKKLEDEKASTIKQFGSLYRLSDYTPYAPLKRFGKYVVTGKSKTLLSAQQSLDGMQDGADRELLRKEVRNMEASGEHQFVDFVDNEYAAVSLEARLRKAGVFAEVQTRERNAASLYSGSGTLDALRAIEAKLNQEPDGQHKRAMLKMVGNMYLTALSEDSARRSEMERVGVTANNADGSTGLDMQRAFESQGKADAFFLAHAAVGRGMQDVFRQMQEQSNEGGDTRAKSSLFNELMLRRLQSLQYEDENISHKLQRLTSKFLLAFSPAYYLQNATQPWMVSLPVMAGRHEYGAAANVLLSKYSQIAQAVKDASLFGTLDYDKILAGVSDKNEREFLERALNEGIIDIGQGIELGESSHYDSAAGRGWAKVDGAVRNLQQKAEAINRITTALTAYELEFKRGKDAGAASAYAERIIRETHGDYGSWNAPRAFNTNLGRVALQFRKYQLIQLSLMAKLIKTWATGASVQERHMARKAFGLMLGQAFLVGGGSALPAPAVAMAAIGAAFGASGDEPPEYLFRKWVGDKDVADVLIHGLPTKLTGVNLSKFGGMGQAVSGLPFQDDLLPTDRTSMESFGYAIVGGPFGGLTLRMADGVSNIANGLWWKGAEAFVPTGVTNISKALRYGVEGDENKRGTLNLAREEFTAWTLAAQAMGVQPSVSARRIYEQGAKYAIETSFKDMSNRLKSEYVRASRDGDAQALAQVREDWSQMQKSQREDGLTPTPLATLLKAPQEARKSESQRQGTQVYKKQSQELGERIAAY